MNYIVALCLASMLAIFVGCVVKLCISNRAGKLAFLKSFKKGKFALIYFAAIPLYWIGIVHAGNPIGGALLLAIKSTVDLVFLKYDYNSVALLMNENLFFRIVMDICCVLVAINAALFTFTLVGQRATNYFWRQKSTKMSKKTYVVIGFNKENRKIVESIEKKDGCVLLLTDVDEKLSDYAFVTKVPYVNSITKNDMGATIKKLFKKFDDKTVNIIVNTGDDAKNLIFIEQISAIIAEMNLSKFSIDDTKGLRAYVFGEPENKSAFLHFEEKTNGCVHYVNKYKLIAMDFVEKHPLTEFMTAEHIDYASATIKNDVKMNVVLIGFGKTNQQLFLTSVANNQFLTRDGDMLKEKAVNYYIYDKADSRNDKNLNHNYYRFSNELASNEKDYLPLPPKPANEKFFSLDINDTNFYESIKENLKVMESEKACNQIVIAFGSDMQNLDFAEKLSAKLKEWNFDMCTHLFAKIRDSALTKNVINKEYAESGKFITFANEKDIVYNLSQIVDEKKEAMALNRHLCYALKDGMSRQDEIDAKTDALRKWYAQAQVQRESNIYACLSIRMKLQLLGYDFRSNSKTTVSAQEKFLADYQLGDPIIYDTAAPIKERRTIVYSNNMPQSSVRHILAVQEHQRWNAYMISSGIIPSTKKQIKDGDSKNFPLRRHGNITTFDGLLEFRKIEAEQRSCSEEETDVIRFDYQLMDDVIWLLTNSGYVVVKK